MIAQRHLVILLLLVASLVAKPEDVGKADAQSLVGATRQGDEFLNAADLAGMRSLLGKRKKKGRRGRRSRKKITLKNQNSSVSEDGATITIQNNSLLRSRDQPVSNVFDSSPLINNIADVNFNVSGNDNQIDTNNR